MRKIFLISLVIIAAFPAIAQKSKKERKEEKRERISAMIKQEEEGVIAYHKQTAFGVKLTSDGYGAFMEIGRASSVKKAILYQLELSERKHRKEDKQSSPYAGTTPFVYGKQNFVYNVKLGVQQQVLLGNKANKNGVAVTANYGGGICLSLQRPYYIQVRDSASGTKFVKYDEKDTSNAYFKDYPLGGPTFSQGWDELKVNPGLYVKGAFRFDYGAYNEVVSAIEVGVCGEYYTKDVPQMIYVSPKKFFLTAYVSIMFGKRK